MANPTPLVHIDLSSTDEALAKEAADHLAQHTHLQYVTEQLFALRAGKYPWWTPSQRREALTAAMRMTMLKQRPDIRQRIMVEVAKTPPNFARRAQPEYQASLLDQYMENPEDLSAEDFENGFLPSELVIYGDVATLFYQFIDAMPWEESSEAHQTLIANLITALLKDRANGTKPLKPILTSWEVVSAIDPLLWHGKIPLETRVAVHNAWLAQEKDKPTQPFTAKQTLGIISPGVITKSIPLESLIGIFKLAESKMGFTRPVAKDEPPATRHEGRSNPPSAAEGDPSAKKP